jgi:uncharacterized membrane protein YdfJ with MMPL/SSD domain
MWVITCLVWLSLEENSIGSACILALTGVGIGLAIQMARFGRDMKLTGRSLVLGSGLFGMLLGLGTAVACTLLMFFKTAVHAHPIPDYSLAQMLGTIARAPAWALAGALLGLAAACLVLASHHPYRAP